MSVLHASNEREGKMYDSETVKQIQNVSKMIQEYVENEQKLFDEITLFFETMEAMMPDDEMKNRKEILDRRRLNVEEMLLFLKGYADDLTSYSNMLQMDINAAKLNGFASTGKIRSLKDLV